MDELVTASASPTAAVRSGSYALELSSTEETFVLFESQPEEANAGNLATALGAAAAEAEATAEAPLLDEVVEDVSVVTERCEKSVRLFNDLAAGKALDPKVVSAEIDALLGLLARLDRTGRHKEALRLARDLAALLALFLRWLELVRTLRLALRTARMIGDREAEAWALHELGSLHLGAGEALASSRHLSEALRIREELGARGRCASRHNLDAARRDLAGFDGPAPRVERRRWLRLAGGGALLAILAAGGLTLGLATSSARHTTPTQSIQPPPTASTHSQPDTATATETSTGPGTSASTGTTTGPSAETGPAAETGSSTATATGTSPPIGPLDSSPPQVVLDAPADGSFLSTAVPTFRGRAGLAPGDLTTIRVRLARGPTAAGDPVELLKTLRNDGGDFSVAASAGLTDGVYTARAEQVDQAGNVGGAAVTFTVDLTQPVVTITSPKSRTQTTDKPTFRGSAGTLPGDLRSVTLTVSKYKAAASSPPVETLSATPDNNGSWSVDSEPLTPGEWYRAVATQADEAGHTGSAEVVFFVANPAPNPR
jgi:hypothetical protein